MSNFEIRALLVHTWQHAGKQSCAEETASASKDHLWIGGGTDTEPADCAPGLIS